MILKIMTRSLIVESGRIDLRITVEFSKRGVLTTKEWKDYKVQ